MGFTIVFHCYNDYNDGLFEFASVAELVDALDLGSSGVARESSSLSARTILPDSQYHQRLFFRRLTTNGCEKVESGIIFPVYVSFLCD